MRPLNSTSVLVPNGQPRVPSARSLQPRLLTIFDSQLNTGSFVGVVLHPSWLLGVSCKAKAELWGSSGEKARVNLKKPSADDDENVRRANLGAIVAVIILVAVVLIVVQVVKSHVLLQNCHMAGFSHCWWHQFPRLY